MLRRLRGGCQPAGDHDRYRSRRSGGLQNCPAELGSCQDDVGSCRVIGVATPVRPISTSATPARRPRPTARYRPNQLLPSVPLRAPGEGQDGELQKGLARAICRQTTAMAAITDLVTGPHVGAAPTTRASTTGTITCSAWYDAFWHQAAGAQRAAASPGYSDWRLPNRFGRLESLLLLENVGPAVAAAFHTTHARRSCTVLTCSCTPGRWNPLDLDDRSADTLDRMVRGLYQLGSLVSTRSRGVRATSHRPRRAGWTLMRVRPRLPVAFTSRALPHALMRESFFRGSPSLPVRPGLSSALMPLPAASARRKWRRLESPTTPRPPAPRLTRRDPSRVVIPEQPYGSGAGWPRQKVLTRCSCRPNDRRLSPPITRPRAAARRRCGLTVD